MNRPVLATATLIASGAQAHPGHIAEVAGHGHWLGAAAIAAAIGVALWQKWKGKSEEAGKQDAPSDTEEPRGEAAQEA